MRALRPRRCHKSASSSRWPGHLLLFCVILLHHLRVAEASATPASRQHGGGGRNALRATRRLGGADDVDGENARAPSPKNDDDEDDDYDAHCYDDEYNLVGLSLSPDENVTFGVVVGGLLVGLGVTLAHTRKFCRRAFCGGARRGRRSGAAATYRAAARYAAGSAAPALELSMKSRAQPALAVVTTPSPRRCGEAAALKEQQHSIARV